MGYEEGHGLLQKGAFWHCRWQFVPPGETSESPLACRSRDPTGQRSAEAPRRPLRWQVYRDPQSRTIPRSSSRHSSVVQQLCQQRAGKETRKTGTQPWKARHGQVGGESCMQINARQTNVAPPSAPQGGGRNPPWPRNIRSKVLTAATASERKSSSEPLHASATCLPSSGETSSKCWRYNPKRGCSNVRYALRAQTACNVNSSQGGNLGSQHVRNPGAVPGFAQDFGRGPATGRGAKGRQKS